MTSSLNAQLITKELDKLDSIVGLIGTALINRNGLTIISRLPRDVDERKFGAMAATLIGAMEAASLTMNEEISSLTVEFEESQLFVFSVNLHIILAILLDNAIDLGLILIEIEEFIKNINMR
jgi:predicted regulator of Ras-like GTPase activity (Roadblock/LC7/MglB family)